MGQALADAFPICRETFREADDALGESLSTLCFEGPEERLLLTENTQPAILAVSVAAYRLAREHGHRAVVCRRAQPRRVLGACCRRYAILRGCPADGAPPRAVHAGGRAGRRRRDGGDPRARCGGRRATPARRPAPSVGEVVSPANLNAPGQVVIAGHADAVARAGELAKARGAKRVIPLAVSAPFHCALMKPAEERLAPELRALTRSDPRIPVVANVDARAEADAAGAIDALIRQVSSPVRWEDVVSRLIADGARDLRRARSRHGARGPDQEDRSHACRWSASRTATGWRRPLRAACGASD